MIKSSLTAILLSSIALVPAATITLVATADAVEAKSGNGNGGGNGGGNKGGNSSKSKSKTENKSASRSSSGSKSKARRSGNDPIGKFLRKVTGQEKKATTKTRRTSSAPKVAKVKDEMHPSNLGKMNGALNANVNALIAHVKNGNTNGPVGGIAALAVAGYAAEGAAETLELEQKFADLDQLLIDNGFVDEGGDPDLAAYLDALEGVPGNGANAEIEAALAGDEGALSIEDALLGENNGEQDFANIDEYEAWRDGVEGADPIEGAEMLIADTEGQDRPSGDEIDYANDRLDDQTAAEDRMLSIWNKGDGDDSVRSESEMNLLEKLYDRIEADGDDLTSAIEEYADLPEPPMDGEDTATCDLEDGCDDNTEELVVAAE